MGFSIRKSVRVGPLRFNLSKSGIGVSTGIPGLRVGIGPRGTYIHIGRGGFYYRQTIAQTQSPISQLPGELPPERAAHPSTHGPMTAIGSACTSEMVDINSSALLAEIERKQKRIRRWPFAAVTSLVLLAYFIANPVSLWVSIPCSILLFAATIVVHQYDQLKKRVVLMYEIEDQCLDAYQALFSATNKVAQCAAVWNIIAQGQVYDPKYHAGAGQLVKRRRVSFSHRNPPFVTTNLSVPCIAMERLTFYLLPDRILAYGSNGVGAVAYDELDLSSRPTQFIEEGSVPRDATIVDRTWRYVNKSGGPDKRFKDNRELPICEYEELEITSSKGIREILQLSRLGSAEDLQASIPLVVESLQLAESAESGRLQNHQSHPNALDQVSENEMESSNVAKADITTEMLQAALFDIICCVMVSDGLASESEKTEIFNVMQKVKSPMTHEECMGRIDSFINEVRIRSYKSTRNHCLQLATLFAKAKRENVLLACIDLVINSNQENSKREQNFRREIEMAISPRE